ncbi:MAG: PspA/IM30 family protein [Proteobacteria bacterium]|nr:PspA/IM30 family protein [Pseudomonadota bacterium]
MASGIGARLYNLWRGFLSLWVSDLEKGHPEIAYENAINAMVEKFAALKKATAGIIRRRDDLTARLESARTELKQVEVDLGAALATDQKDLGLVLIQKKQALVEQIAELEAELSQAVGDADGAKASLLQVQSEIGKLKAEKDRMLGKLASAQARLRIQEQLEGLSVDAEVKALEGVRDHIKTAVAEANLGQELGSSDLDTRLAKLRQSAGSVTAGDEWEKLKAARAQGAQRTL